MNQTQPSISNLTTDLKISRILHAGYVFECGDTKIAFDTIFENPLSRNCYAFPEVRFDYEQIKALKFDAVFISHYHDDHYSMESLNLLDRRTPIYMFCVFEEMFSLIRQLGFKNVYSLELDQPVVIGSIEITPRRALDADVDSVFQIKAAGFNVLNVVDSWIDYSTLDLLVQQGPWDMIMWPFQTMREIEVLAPSRYPAADRELPSEWMEQLKELNPKFVVPSSCQFIQESWSWYNNAFFPITYAQFNQQVQSALPNAKIVRMNPSVSVVLRKVANSAKLNSPITSTIIDADSLSWVQAVGNQDVDYHYDHNMKPTPTAEIATKFVALTSEQIQRVREYCQTGLIEKYRLLDSPADEYFDKPRRWRLALFDHQGQLKEYNYLVCKSDIQMTEDTSIPLAWSTEVPVAKLYAALEDGESLTSMYVRINDLIFDSEIEKEIQSADVMEDPLIRCLFTGVFGSYQKAQLKKILLNQ